MQSASLVPSGRPRAVVVEQHRQGRPDGAALLSFSRRGPATAVTLLGDAVGPVPGGRPPSRLLARDDDVARRLAEGVLETLDRLRGPWTMRLGGLPLGDPTVRHLAAALPSASLANARSRRLVDELDSVADVVRTTDPAGLDRWLPAVLDRLPAPDRPFVRASARLHAAVGALELAVVPGDDAPAALLLTLLDPVSGDRWPWWGASAVGGLRRELGSPVVTLTASAGLRVLGRR
ncbi:hypothetical protein [Modestobacter sp. DSM 44400]|uniref:hypothetical protein n=1 Tax=Modestobacter sp. DSM 44400 TaxID=1550230 RepID=UPI0020C8EEB3|nr:hypothetical protein [Modestobacter sp. DSM 44400]